MEKEKWRCIQCEFDNLSLLHECEICESPRDKKIDEERIKCRMCNYGNEIWAIKCLLCTSPMRSEEKTVLKACPSCHFENDAANTECVSCENSMVILSKPKRRRPAKYNYCAICGMRSVGDDCTVCYKDDGVTAKVSFCMFCFTKIDEEHVCDESKQFYDVRKNATFDRCSALQIETMLYMHDKSKKRHFKSKEAFETRIRGLGYSMTDLENLHHYIVNYAPIIIHMHVNTHFHFFLGDTHYRNQFETAKSSGSLSTSARTQWEDRMFDKHHHSASGFERVKYGTMNFTNDPKGVRACASYGQSYFLLKTHVRDRCTITDMDSSSPSSTIATFRFINHLLCKLSDAEIKSAFAGAKAEETTSAVIGAYKEIQIHGPVEFKQDIERVYISKQELKLGDPKLLLESVKSFCLKNNVEYELIEGEAVGIGMPFGSKPAIEEEGLKQRYVESSTELKKEDLVPPPPPPPLSVFGGAGFGGGFGGFGVGSVGFGGVGGFGVPSVFALKPSAPKKVPKFEEDYI